MGTSTASTAAKRMLEEAYLAGFCASGEGYNGEYPFQDRGRRPDGDKVWVVDRDNYVREALATTARQGGLTQEIQAQQKVSQ